ncbi:glycosyltransferase [Mycobacterium asiaticum]|uniref:glycosyltransferase n=1 Tax=Mycobacterium asiaticum TaxID=1790 RepID=UPI0005633E52|nr:glycosyltransferase [Mycobacterium asiaticum]OBJ59294.1 hypothetical protein A9W94_15175 [Mycobacterium asiaticum]ORA12803.1 hypothetical protein BST16_16155 [Mycobacterium asiaticum DSM 44297]
MSETFAAGSPKVSVVSITYNQEAYIRDALDGFVAQKTDFPVEVVIADDASTDTTPAIVREYAERYPVLFRPILRSENIGVYANFVQTLAAARGQYVALCEGDDFWTDPLKLAKQVEFMDQHPETTVCFHPVRVVHTDGTPDSVFPPLRLRRKLSLEALLERNFIQTNSVMYRRDIRYDDIPANVMPLDWYLHVRHAINGEIAMLPETMAVYRRQPQGIWYDVDRDRQEFWRKRGHGMTASLNAMLDLVSGDEARERIVGKVSDIVFAELARLPGPSGHAVLHQSIADHPRLAALAWQHRWTGTPLRRLERKMSKAQAATQVYSAAVVHQFRKGRRSGAQTQP